MKGSGQLVVVATPIGNLGDLSPRAAEMLSTADLVLAEDTRRTATLLRHVGSSVRMLALHDHNEEEMVAEVIARLQRGETLALVTDAGTPSVSDPGLRVTRAALDEGLSVTTIPGPSAAVAAISVAGLPTDRFVFEGFLPRKPSSRDQRLAELAAERRTVVLFVSVHRAADDLRDLATALGPDRRAVACRELTKLHEQIMPGTLGDLVDQSDALLKGELTLVVAGAPPAAPPTIETLVGEVGELVENGSSQRDAVAEVASRVGVSRRELYQAVLAASSDG
jgi:16S rRNA (cytidine1402-2'-O)-methyltransferase